MDWDDDKKAAWWNTKINAGEKSYDDFRAWCKKTKPSSYLMSQVVFERDETSPTPPPSTKQRLAELKRSHLASSPVLYEVEGQRMEWKKFYRWAVAQGYRGAGGPFFLTQWLRSRGVTVREYIDGKYIT